MHHQNNTAKPFVHGDRVHRKNIPRPASLFRPEIAAGQNGTFEKYSSLGAHSWVLWDGESHHEYVGNSTLFPGEYE